MRAETTLALLSAPVPLLHFTLHAIAPGLVSAILLALGAMVFIRQSGSRPARAFSQIMLLLGTWLFAFTVMGASTTVAAASTWARIGLAAVAFLPAAVYQFTVTALRLMEARRPIVALGWISSAVFAVTCLATDAVVGSMQSFPWGWYPRLAWLGPLFLVFLFAALLGQFFEYVHEQKVAPLDSRREGLRKLMVSFAIAYLAGIDFLPMLGLSVYPIGCFFILAFLAYAGGSIQRHRLSGITPARAAREILDTMADALIVSDADGRIRLVNGAAQTLFGYGPSELLGRSIEFLDFDESFPLRNLFNRGMFRDVETRFRTRSGEPLDVSVSVSPLSDRDGESGAVMIARDIRERKEAEKAHREFLARLRESNRELEDFARVASHDLQEPLRKIQAFGERLRAEYADRLPGGGLDYLDRMQSAAVRMQTLITDLLAFSRVTTKADPFVPVDLKHIVEEVVGDLEVRISQSKARVEVGSLPSIEADPLQMRQLFQNLVSNALKFRKPDVSPRVAIEGRLLNGSRRAAACQIRVCDNGIGFEEKNLDRVFNMFQRLHGRSEFEGSGIGLAICRKIVERHGGDITARSAPGQGSTFIVTLPLRRQSGEAA